MILMYSDGACRGNPGPASYGVVFKDKKGKLLKELSEYIGHKTNNVAEYTGLIQGLTYALKARFLNLDVYLDSELVVKQINGIYKVKHPEMKICYQKVIELKKQFESCSVSHILRHKNTEADALANKALDEK